MTYKQEMFNIIFTQRELMRYTGSMSMSAEV